MKTFLSYNQIVNSWEIAESTTYTQTANDIDWLFVTKNRIDVHKFEVPVKYEYVNASDHNARYIEATIW